MRGDISVVSSTVVDTIVDGGFVESDASSDCVSKGVVVRAECAFSKAVELFKVDVVSDVKAFVDKSEVKVILVEVGFEITLKHFFIYLYLNKL